jgi:DNA excision repair protein ERCC-1
MEIPPQSGLNDRSARSANGSSIASSSSTAAMTQQLLVNEVQRGNPLLVHIKNVKWTFTKDIIPDYSISNACALFVSLKYHFRHPKVSWLFAFHNFV